MASPIPGLVRDAKGAHAGLCPSSGAKLPVSGIPIVVVRDLAKGKPVFFCVF